MIPGGSITNRSELGVNIQKNPGLIQKKRSGNIPKRTIRLLPTPLPDRSSPLPFLPPGLRTAPGCEWVFGRRHRLSHRTPVLTLRPGSRLWEGFRGDASVYRAVLRFPRLRPGSRLWEAFRGDASVYRAASSSPGSGPAPGFGRVFGDASVYRAASSPLASLHPGCGEDTALRTASPSFRPDGQTRRG